VRRLALVALLIACGGCGTASPDLFEVKRSGEDRNANLTMVVNDGGHVTCNGEQHALDGDRLLRAREIERELEEPAELGLELPPGPNANLSYRVRLEAGTVAFSDTSRGNPQAFNRVAAFTKDVAERVCGIVR
jgi:ferredoxin